MKTKLMPLTLSLSVLLLSVMVSSSASARPADADPRENETNATTKTSEETKEASRQISSSGAPVQVKSERAETARETPHHRGRLEE